MSVGTDSSWTSREADTYFNPTPLTTPGAHSTGLVESGNEYLDGRHEVIGWNTAHVLPILVADEHAWAPPIVVPAPVSRAADGSTGMHSKMAHPEEIVHVPEIKPVPMRTDGAFFVDFKSEFQGGLRLRVNDGVTGCRVRITTGEIARGSNSGDYSLSNTWKYQVRL
eukprot:SAG11_NODE_15956_length_561_cov_1.335498_1_plen_167_part_00